MKQEKKSNMNASAIFYVTLLLVALYPLNGNSGRVEIDGIYYDNSYSEWSVVDAPTDTPYSGDYYIPDSVNVNGTMIPVSSIVKMSGIDLGNVSLGPSIKFVERRAFAGSGIISFTGSQNMLRIYDRAFEGCKRLNTVTLSGYALNIGPLPVESPDPIYSISRAFANCTSLTDLYLLQTPWPPQIDGGDNFICDDDGLDKDLIYKQCTLHVPEEMVEKYRNWGTEWSKFVNIKGDVGSVNSPIVDGVCTATSIERYDISGRRLDANVCCQGVVIERVQMSDGSTKVYKCLRP